MAAGIVLSGEIFKSTYMVGMPDGRERQLIEYVSIANEYTFNKHMYPFPTLYDLIIPYFELY